MRPRVLIYGFHSTELRRPLRAELAEIAGIEYWIGVNTGDEKFDADIVDWHLGRTPFEPSPVQVEQWEPTADRIVAAHRESIVDQLRRNSVCADWEVPRIVNLGKRLAIYFLELLTTRHIDFVLLQNLPHEGFEWLLYLAAAELKIRRVACYQSIITNHFFYCHELSDFGFFRDCQPTSGETVPPVAFGFRKDLFYMKGIELLQPKRLTWRERWKDLKARVGYYRWRGKTPYRTATEQYEANLRRTIQDFDLHRPFVYFPLHLQPELTTSTLGDEFRDQLLALEHLDSWLPHEIAIVAKENPKQDHRWRGPEFFKRFRRIRRAQLVPTATNTYELLERSLFAATITGTVGWEAITGGKAALVFGRPWYLSLPGVFHWRDSPTFEQLLKHRLQRDLFDERYRQLMAKSRPGLVDLNYRAGFPDYHSETNGQMIAKFVRSLIQSK